MHDRFNRSLVFVARFSSFKIFELPIIVSKVRIETNSYFNINEVSIP